MIPRRMTDEEIQEEIGKGIEPQGALLLPHHEQAIIFFVKWDGWKQMWDLQEADARSQWRFYSFRDSVCCVYYLEWPDLDLDLRLILYPKSYKRMLQYLANGISLCIAPAGSTALTLKTPKAPTDVLKTVFPPELSMRNYNE